MVFSASDPKFGHARSTMPMKSQKVAKRPKRATQSSKSGGGFSANVSAESIGKLIKPAIILILLVAAAVAYDRITRSSAFSLHTIEVNGASQALEAEVKQAVRQKIGQQQLLDVNLDDVRKAVQSIQKVRTATVMRKLPDSISVSVSERQAVLPVRRGQTVEWFDQDAVPIGDISSIKMPGGIPPVATGFSDDSTAQGGSPEDKDRIALYKQIEQEFSKEPNPIWNMVDEVDLSFVKDVNVRLINPPVLIHLGSRDFRARTETALKILQAIKQGDVATLSRIGVQDPQWVVHNAGHIQVIDALRPDRVVLSFSTSKQDSQTKQAPAKHN